MTSSESPPPPTVLYACVAHGSTVLAELLDPDPVHALDLDDPDLLSTAYRCIAAAPRHHRIYTHTARGRIHAFLMPDPDSLILFFTIAHESFPRSDAILLLHRLRHAFLSSNLLLDPPSSHCLQNQLLPVLHNLLSPSDPPEATPSPPQSPSPVDDLVDDRVVVEETIDNERKERKKKHKLKKKKSSVAGENRTTILVSDDEIGDQIACLSFRRVKQARRVWERLVRVALIVDLLICSFLFVIWIMVCRGFKCLAA